MFFVCLIWFFTSHQQSFSYIGTGRSGSNPRLFGLESCTLPLRFLNTVCILPVMCICCVFVTWASRCRTDWWHLLWYRWGSTPWGSTPWTVVVMLIVPRLQSQWFVGISRWITRAPWIIPRHRRWIPVRHFEVLYINLMLDYTQIHPTLIQIWKTHSSLD